MKYILFDTISAEALNSIQITDVLVMQSMPSNKGIELMFFPYYYPYSNGMETFTFEQIYKWKEASEKLAQEYIHVTTGIIASVDSQTSKKIITG